MPNRTRSSALQAALRAGCLTLAVVVSTGVGAAPAEPPAPLPQSSADLVGRLFADRGWIARVDSTRHEIVDQVTGRASDMIETAMNFIGVRYKRGGTSADSGFDCSGFTRRVFESSVGLLLPRRADEQAKASNLKPVEREALKPGDLVFFNTLRRTFSHVGIYVGDHKFIHSPSAGGEVRVDDMRFGYWAKRFTGARRADLDTVEAAAPARSGR